MTDKYAGYIWATGVMVTLAMRMAQKADEYENSDDFIAGANKALMEFVDYVEVGVEPAWMKDSAQ